MLVELSVVSGEQAMSQEGRRAVGFAAWMESFVGMRGLEVGSEFGVCQERGPYAGGAREDGAEKALESSSRARKKRRSLEIHCRGSERVAKLDRSGCMLVK